MNPLSVSHESTRKTPNRDQDYFQSSMIDVHVAFHLIRKWEFTGRNDVMFKSTHKVENETWTPLQVRLLLATRYAGNGRERYNGVNCVVRRFRFNKRVGLHVD